MKGSEALYAGLLQNVMGSSCCKFFLGLRQLRGHMGTCEEGCMVCGHLSGLGPSESSPFEGTLLPLPWQW